LFSFNKNSVLYDKFHNNFEKVNLNNLQLSIFHISSGVKPVKNATMQVMNTATSVTNQTILKYRRNDEIVMQYSLN